MNRFLAAVGAAVVASACFFAPITLADTFTYQGELRFQGDPVTDLADFRFTLHDAAVGGLQIGPMAELQDEPLLEGKITADLNFGAGAFNGAERWIEIQVRVPAGTGSFVTLQPRQRVKASPYSIHAQTVGIVPPQALSGEYTGQIQLSNPANVLAGGGAQITGLNATNIATGTIANARTTGASSNTANALVLRDASGNFSAGTITGTFSGSGSGLSGLNASNISTGTIADARLSSNVPLRGAVNTFTQVNVFNANVGIGTTSPNTRLHVNSPAATAALRAQVDGATKLLVASTGGVSIGANQSSPPANGLYVAGRVGVGIDAPLAELHVAGIGGNADLLLKRNDATHGFNFGVSATPKLFIARYDGTTFADILTIDGSTDQVGIGTTSPSSPLHVTGPASNSNPTIFADHPETGTTTAAILGTNTDTNLRGIGVEGRAAFFGVWGEGVASDGGGTQTGQRFGVRGSAHVSGVDNYGVYGATNSGSPNHAVWANGDLTATGNKSFQIDHPLDPENKYLKHYCTESPEPLNVYRGRVTLNEAGEAWIELPDYFDTINRDPLYTLTAIGAAMPNLHVAVEVVDNTFKIAGGSADMSVSWRVEAVRNDRYVQTYGAPVEIEKAAWDRGSYLHPELYGHPPEKGTHNLERMEAMSQTQQGTEE